MCDLASASRPYTQGSFSTCSFSLCSCSLCRLLHNRLGRFCCVRCTIAVDAGVRNHYMLEIQAIHTSTDSAVSPHLSIVVLIARHGGHGREKPGRRMPGNYIDSCSEQQNIRRTCQTWITIDVAAAMPQVYCNFITTTITTTLRSVIRPARSETTTLANIISCLMLENSCEITMSLDKTEHGVAVLDSPMYEPLLAQPWSTT